MAIIEPTLPRLPSTPAPEPEAAPVFSLEGLAQDFARLKADPLAWQAELEERAVWDATLSDGLD
jgi:hypothetical protein